MDRIAEYLSEKETITGKQFMEIYNEVLEARNGGETKTADENTNAEEDVPETVENAEQD